MVELQAQKHSKTPHQNTSTGNCSLYFRSLGRSCKQQISNRALQKLLPGDAVLANCGCDITDSVASMYKLHCTYQHLLGGIPQLSVKEIGHIASVRIHVERVIGLVRQKYPILRSTIPVHYLTKRLSNDLPLIDHIVRVCCALSNICDSVVPLDYIFYVCNSCINYSKQ